MTKRNWTEQERAFIAQNAGTMKDVVLADELSKVTGVPVDLTAVRRQRQSMGIKKARGRGKCALAPVVVVVPAEAATS